MRTAFSILIALFCFFSCGPSGMQVGTNTNWMRICEEDTECGSEAACLCGRCTTPCSSSSDEDCPAGNICAPAPAARLQCGGEENFTCQPACTGNAGCEEGRLCYQGVCTDGLKDNSCPKDALFCEDFEEESLDYEDVVSGGNLLAPTSMPAPSGRAALQVHVEDGPSVAFARGPLPFVSDGELYLSAWMRVPDQEAHNVAPLAFWSSTEESWALRLVVADARVKLWTETTPLGESVELTPGGWHCLQVHVNVAEAPEGSATLSVDGQNSATINDLDTLPDGGIEAVAMGTLWAASAADFDLDRVIVSTRPINCYR